MWDFWTVFEHDKKYIWISLSEKYCIICVRIWNTCIQKGYSKYKIYYVYTHKDYMNECHRKMFSVTKIPGSKTHYKVGVLNHKKNLSNT